jgi:hypothetical protein
MTANGSAEWQCDPRKTFAVVAVAERVVLEVEVFLAHVALAVAA